MNSPTRRLHCENLEDRRVFAALVGDGQIVQTTCTLGEQDVSCEKFLDTPVAMVDEVRILPAHMDLSKDGRVSVRDLALLAFAYNRDPNDADRNDMNEDGRFSSKDFIVMVNALRSAPRNVAMDLTAVDNMIDSVISSASERFVADNPFVGPIIIANLRNELSNASSTFEFLRFDLAPDNSEVSVEFSLRKDDRLAVLLTQITDQLGDTWTDDLPEFVTNFSQQVDGDSIMVKFNLVNNANQLDEVFGNLAELDSIVAPYSGAIDQLLANRLFNERISGLDGAQTLPIVQVQNDRIGIYTYDQRFLSDFR